MRCISNGHLFFTYTTPGNLSLTIKKIMGDTLTGLQRKIKLDHAKYLLKNSNFSVSDIISKVGYSNLSYFYRQFKEDTGVTPDEYRKK